MIARISFVVIATGTAEYTCLPAFSAARTSGPCVQRWVKIATASTAADSSMAAYDGKVPARPCAAASRSARSGSRSVTWGVGGRVRERAVVAESAFLGWRDVPFAALLQERTGLPVVVENDVAALVEAETWFGAGRGLDRFAVLTVGAGLGYGLVLGGTRVPFEEEDRGFGRYWILDPSGPLTPDGARGSAVSLLTVPGTGTDARYEDILAGAGAGEPMASRVIGEAARALGTLVAQIANVAMPQKILLAGEGVGLMDVAGNTVRETVRAHRHPLAAPVDLETRVSDFHDWARGAAVLAIQVLVLGGREK